MKVKWKKLWIKALLSGKYAQGQQALRSDDAYCCLGVLCRVTEPHTPWKRGNHSEFTFKNEESCPPADTLKKVGLTRGSAKVLANLNDDKGFSFNKIAEYIKHHY